MTRTALVTGSSSGFGRGVVSGLLARGFRVYATLRDAEQRAGEFADDLTAHPERLVLLSLDVTDAAERARVVERVQKDCPDGLDCLINNAGFGLFGALENLAEEQLRRQFEVNFFGAALLTRDLLPCLRAARGVVLNVSSVFGFSGFPLTGAYCASKYALEGLSEALYHELRPHGVRVGLVEPGGHRTRFGTSIEWGKGDVAAFREQTQGYQALRDKLISRPDGNPADPVVATLVRLATSKRVPLRTVVGRDAHATRALHKLVPERVRVPVMSVLLARLLRARNAS